MTGTPLALARLSLCRRDIGGREGAPVRPRSKPTVVVAHSYGSVVVVAAAWDVPSVRHLLVIGGVLPEIDQSSPRSATEAPRPTVVELDTGHHPFLSQPSAVADLVLGL